MGLFGNLFDSGSPSMFGEGGIFAPPPAPQAQMPQSFSMPQSAQTGAQFGIDPATQQSVNQAAAMPPQQTGPKFNEPGGWGERLGGAAAALRDDPSVFANYQQNQTERAKLRMAQTQAERGKLDQWNLWLQQQQYKAAHPDAPQPTELQRNYEYLQQTDPTAAAQYKHRMTNDVTWRQGPDGQFYPVQIPTPTVLGAELPQGWKVQQGGAGSGQPGFRP